MTSMNNSIIRRQIEDSDKEIVEKRRNSTSL